LRPGSSAFTERPSSSLIPLSAKAATSAAESSADAGIGLESGLTSVISHAPRTPRAAR
jgi:hypothetical protein